LCKFSHGGYAWESMRGPSDIILNLSNENVVAMGFEIETKRYIKKLEGIDKK
jgi:hypothetical protein